MNNNIDQLNMEVLNEKPIGETIEQYWNVFKRRWPIVLIITLVVVGFRMFQAYRQTPVYMANGTLMIEQENQNILNLRYMPSSSDWRNEYLNTQIFVLRSRSLVQNVIEDLRLLDKADVPGKNTKPVRVPPMNTYKQKPLPTKAKKVDPNQDITYTKLSITSPTADAVIHENTGDITVSLETDPKLDKQHSIKVTLNGDEASALSGDSLSYTFKNVPRGSHKLQAAIINKEGDTLISSSVIEFHLRRFVTPPPAPAKKADKPK